MFKISPQESLVLWADSSNFSTVKMHLSSTVCKQIPHMPNIQHTWGILTETNQTHTHAHAHILNAVSLPVWRDILFQSADNLLLPTQAVHTYTHTSCHVRRRRRRVFTWLWIYAERFCALGLPTLHTLQFGHLLTTGKCIRHVWCHTESGEIR